MNVLNMQSTYQEGQQYSANCKSVLFCFMQLYNETAGQLGDKEVDTEQTGAGFTPMIGVNFSPVENLNIALKYEMKTILELPTKPKWMIWVCFLTEQNREMIYQPF
jgi:long-chain fatty acid transport protein